MRARVTAVSCDGQRQRVTSHPMHEGRRRTGGAKCPGLHWCSRRLVWRSSAVQRWRVRGAGPCGGCGRSDLACTPRIARRCPGCPRRCSGSMPGRGESQENRRRRRHGPWAGGASRGCKARDRLPTMNRAARARILRPWIGFGASVPWCCGLLCNPCATMARLGSSSIFCHRPRRAAMSLGDKARTLAAGVASPLRQRTCAAGASTLLQHLPG